MRFFRVRRNEAYSNNNVSYSKEELEEIDELQRLFRENIHSLINVDDFEVISQNMFSSVLIDSITNKLISFFYRIKGKMYNREILSMIVTGFLDIFIAYLLHENYSISERKIKGILVNFMETGRMTIQDCLFNEGFFELDYQRKVVYISKDLHQRIYDKDSPKSCPFAYLSKERFVFITHCWIFIHDFFLPNLRKKFEYQGKIENLIIKANNKDSTAQVELFHLGLLGPYERGEVNTNN